MNRIKVNLLNVTPPEVILSALGKPYKNDKVSVKLIKAVSMGETKFSERHGSTLEFVNIDFEILGCSRLCLQELARHRHASFCVESTRFVLNKLMLDPRATDLYSHEGQELMDELFVRPEIDKHDPKFASISEHSIREFQHCHADAVTMSMECLKKMYILGIPNDISKYMVNESLRTNLNMSVNLRSLLNILRLRLDKTAHFEIRHVVGLMLEEAKKTWMGELFD